MRTTPAEREAWRAEVTLRHPDMSPGDATMALAVLDDLAECEARCEALQSESEAHAKWLEETWPTIEDRVLGDLVRECDEALAKVASLTQERDENAEIAKRALATGLEHARRVREWQRGWFGGEDLPDQAR